jgi:hypothetical protein
MIYIVFFLALIAQLGVAQEPAREGAGEFAHLQHVQTRRGLQGANSFAEFSVLTQNDSRRHLAQSTNWGCGDTSAPAIPYTEHNFERALTLSLRYGVRFASSFSSFFHSKSALLCAPGLHHSDTSNNGTEYNVSCPPSQVL